MRSLVYGASTKIMNKYVNTYRYNNTNIHYKKSYLTSWKTKGKRERGREKEILYLAAKNNSLFCEKYTS